MMSTTTTTTTTPSNDALRQLQDWLRGNDLKDTAKTLSNSLLPVGDPGFLYGQLLAFAFNLYLKNKEQVPTPNDILRKLGIAGDVSCKDEFSCPQVQLNQSVTEVRNYLQQSLPQSERACSSQLSGALNLAIFILSGQKQPSDEDENKGSDNANIPSNTVFTYAYQQASLFRPVPKSGPLIISPDFWTLLSDENLKFFIEFETQQDQGKIMLLREKGESKEGFWYLFFMSRLLELFRSRELTSQEVQTRMSKVCHFFTLPLSSAVTTSLKSYLVDPKCANTAEKWANMVAKVGEQFKSANQATLHTLKLSPGLRKKETTFAELTQWYNGTKGASMSQKEWKEFKKKEEQLRKLTLDGQLSGDDTEPEQTSGSVTNNATSPLETSYYDAETVSNESSNDSGANSANNRQSQLGRRPSQRGRRPSQRGRRHRKRNNRSRSPLAHPLPMEGGRHMSHADATDSEHSDSASEHSDSASEHSDSASEHSDSASEHSDSCSQSSHFTA